MAQTTTMTIRLDKKMQKQLEEIAIYEKRSKSFLAAEAVENYLTMRAAQIEGIHKAMVSIDAGQGITNEEMKIWIKKLASST